MVNLIEKLIHAFLWSGIGEEVKFHLVGWNKFCSPTFNGCLVVRNLGVFNKVSLGKWL